MTGKHATVERSALVTGSVIAVLLLGLFHSVVAGAVERGPTRLAPATDAQRSAVVQGD